MRRRRKLSRQDIQWVGAYITELCCQHSVNPNDEDYRSAAWTAFQALFQSFYSLADPAFWSLAAAQMETAIHLEKYTRNLYLYRMVSLDVPLTPDTGETFLDMLPAPHGDFTNGVAFRDFLDKLPDDLSLLARRLIDRDTLEEARSGLGWTPGQLCVTVRQLQSAVDLYEAS